MLAHMSCSACTCPISTAQTTAQMLPNCAHVLCGRCSNRMTLCPICSNLSPNSASHQPRLSAELRSAANAAACQALETASRQQLMKEKASSVLSNNTSVENQLPLLFDNKGGAESMLSIIQQPSDGPDSARENKSSNSGNGTAGGNVDG